MEREFIPYAEALVLKELGFNEPCIGWFGSSCCIQLEKTFKNRSGDSKQNVKWNGCVNGPTFHQAFRWFREKHNLIGLIEIGTQEFSYQIFNIKGDRQLGNEPLSFNGTQEEAELKCLKEIIEIVKTSKELPN